MNKFDEVLYKDGLSGQTRRGYFLGVTENDETPTAWVVDCETGKLEPAYTTTVTFVNIKGMRSGEAPHD